MPSTKIASIITIVPILFELFELLVLFVLLLLLVLFVLFVNSDKKNTNSGTVTLPSSVCQDYLYYHLLHDRFLSKLPTLDRMSLQLHE